MVDVPMYEWIHYTRMMELGVHVYDAAGQRVARVVECYHDDNHIQVKCNAMVVDDRVAGRRTDVRGAVLTRIPSGELQVAVAHIEIEGGIICTEAERDEWLKERV